MKALNGDVKRRKLTAAGARALPAPGPHGPHSVITVGSDFYLLASSAASRRTPRVLANARSFAVFDVAGDILASPLEALGFFNHDTRYLCRFELRIGGKVAYFLNSYLSDDKAQLRINLTNSDLYGRDGAVTLPRDSLQIERNWVLADGTLHHRLTIRNYARERIEIALDFLMGVDFADIFEVRGVKRRHRGALLDPELCDDLIRFTYQGLDGVTRTAEIAFSMPPQALNGGRATFMLDLAPERSAVLDATVITGRSADGAGARPARGFGFDRALAVRRSEIAQAQGKWARLSASNEFFDSLLKRSIADLTSIIAQTPESTFMMAGIPWFATLFGRDSIITTMSVLPFNPEIAANTLRALARMQGSAVDAQREEQPGKIAHEIRAGEMAATGEVPFGRYYGSVDATPLFLWLLARCVATSGDLVLADELWPNAERAVEWIEQWGDPDGDGYVEYARSSDRGLENQGWKDSHDAISHTNGDLARGPIALAEVQAYVYAACVGLAQVAVRLGRNAFADRLTQRAHALRKTFARNFWLERERTVALALDGEKQPCRVMTSNAGHCLAAGLLDGDQASALSQRLLADDMFSGWGVRTLGANERRYNPMGYHNGTVWPHDNGIVAMGLARYGNTPGAVRILEGLFDAAIQLNSPSLPELFCGFPREPRIGPVPYPVACYPQAWSAASIFMILQASLGLQVDAFEHRVVIDSPMLPAWLDWLRIEDLKVAGDSLSLILRRTSDGSATAEILEKRGAISVEIKK